MPVAIVYMIFFPAWLQCTHLNVAAEKNGATCISSSSEAGRECNKTIDGRTEAGSKNHTFAFNSTQSANHSIKIQFTRHFLVNKLRVMQLDSDSTQISSVRLEFSDFSSEEVRFENLYIAETSLSIIVPKILEKSQISFCEKLKNKKYCIPREYCQRGQSGSLEWSHQTISSIASKVCGKRKLTK